jgi:hypothetical protein
MPTSPDTLLRRVRAAKTEPGPPPRYVGIDDWACKKGQSYGTILIDLERGRVIDLLPGRDGEAVAEWLRKNPQVEVITWDRWAAYAKAAIEAAPRAKQVADRWHLLKNLREAIENLIARFGPEIRTAAAPPSEADTPSSPPTNAPPSPTEASATESPPTEPRGPELAPAGPSVSAPTPPSAQASTPPSAREAKQQARQVLRRRVCELREQGLLIRTIAQQMRMSPQTVLSVLRDPDRPHGSCGRRRKSARDEFRADVDGWMTAGGTNTADLYRLLQGKGCRISCWNGIRGYPWSHLSLYARRPGIIARSVNSGNA